jgi:hypothetical protein
MTAGRDNGMDKLQEAVGTVTKISHTGAVTETKEKVGLLLSDGPVAEVGCDLGYTMNLGNYQSLKIGVSLRLPVNVTPDALDKGYEFVKNWVDGKLTAAINEAKETIG